jgi:anti-anti-sigma regulatory factor
VNPIIDGEKFNLVMRKNSNDTLHRIRGERSAYERVRRREFLHNKRKSRLQAVGDYKWQDQRLVIEVPEQLDLRTNRTVTLELAAACRTNCLKLKKRTVLDFSNTKLISSAAILLLVAEIDRCRRIAGVRMLSGTYPTDRRLHRQMRDSGFFDALGVKASLDTVPKVFPLEYIKVQSGTQADGRLAVELRRALFGPHEEQLARDKKGSFFRGLTEAMTNVAQHAYPDDFHVGAIKVIKKGWWMLGHINKLRKELKIMIVDQGIGIPRSLPRTHKDIIATLLATLNLDMSDGAMIKAAMEVGRSRMGQTHRGKGLNDLKQIIDLCQSGRLRILSRKGEYIYRVRHGKSAAFARGHAVPLNGTLVEWTIPLDAILPFLTLDESVTEEK